MKTLPPNIHAPLAELATLNTKRHIGSVASGLALEAMNAGADKYSVGSIVMMATLDVALEHWLVWHMTKGLIFDVEAFLELVKRRLVLAQVNVERDFAEMEGAVQ